MSIKPILFNTEMVKAILDGRKTVTRRVIKSRPPLNKWKFYELHDNRDGAITCKKDKLCAGFYKDEHIFYIDGEKYIDARYYPAPCKPGDILYVRETWRNTSAKMHTIDLQSNKIVQTAEHFGYEYKAHIFDKEPPYFFPDGFKESEDNEHLSEITFSGKWHPSIHMPKEAARIWLKVLNVKVERIQDASNLRKEGIRTTEDCDRCYAVNGHCNRAETTDGCDDAINTFAELWNSTIKNKYLPLYGWDVNPWVWVIEFERCEKPEVSKV